MNLHNFWYGSCSSGVLWENHSLFAGKILGWQNFGHFKVKNSQFLVFLTYNIQMLLWILQFSGLEVVLVVFLVFFISFFSVSFFQFLLFSGEPIIHRLVFGMEVVLMVFFEKIIFYMPGKLWYGENLATLRPKFGHFCPK